MVSDLPSLPETKAIEMPPPPETMVMYSVFVQMEYRISAADGADAIAQIGLDLGQGRSYRHYTELTMALNARQASP